MDFSTKYSPPKRTDFGPHPEQSFGEVVWTGAFFPCHNWPCQKLTGWVAYIEDGGLSRAHVCSEECLHELGGKVQTVQAAVEPEPQYERICVPMVVVEPAPNAKVVQATTEVREIQPIAEPLPEPPPTPPTTKPLALSSFKMDDTLKKLLGKT